MSTPNKFPVLPGKNSSSGQPTSPLPLPEKCFSCTGVLYYTKALKDGKRKMPTCFGMRQQLRDDPRLGNEAIGDDDDDDDMGRSHNIWVSENEEVRGLAIGYSIYGQSDRNDSKKPFCKYGMDLIWVKSDDDDDEDDDEDEDDEDEEDSTHIPTQSSFPEKLRPVVPQSPNSRQNDSKRSDYDLKKAIERRDMESIRAILQARAQERMEQRNKEYKELQDKVAEEKLKRMNEKLKSERNLNPRRTINEESLGNKKTQLSDIFTSVQEKVTSERIQEYTKKLVTILKVNFYSIQNYLSKYGKELPEKAWRFADMTSNRFVENAPAAAEKLKKSAKKLYDTLTKKHQS